MTAAMITLFMGVFAWLSCGATRSKARRHPPAGDDVVPGPEPPHAATLNLNRRGRTRELQATLRLRAAA